MTEPVSPPPRPEAPAARPRLSVVVPAYNEERRIAATLRRIREYFDSVDMTAEIVVVDDGSADRTVEVAREAAPEIRVLSNPENRGKGFSVRRGMMEARGEYVLFSDADLSTPIEEIEKFWPAFDQGADVVIGSRAIEGSDIQVRQGRLREKAGRAFNFAIRQFVGLPFRDTQCGFKAFRREAAQAIFPRQRLTRWAFDAELLVIARRQGLTVRERPVRWINSPDSRLKFFRDAPKILLEVLRIRINSLMGRYG